MGRRIHLSNAVIERIWEIVEQEFISNGESTEVRKYFKELFVEKVKELRKRQGEQE